MATKTTLGRSRAARRFGAFRRSTAGAAVVEFALIVPVFTLILFAIIDFGRALWMQNVLVSALREGARKGAAAYNGSALDSGTTANGPRDRAAQYINTALGSSLTASSIGMTYCQSGSTTSPCNGSSTDGIIFVWLAISGRNVNTYPFTALTPLISRYGLNQVSVPRAAFRWELSG
jgi:Flp pilus assembly protein TadG